MIDRKLPAHLTVSPLQDVSKFHFTDLPLTFSIHALLPRYNQPRLNLIKQPWRRKLISRQHCTRRTMLNPQPLD